MELAIAGSASLGPPIDHGLYAKDVATATRAVDASRAAPFLERKNAGKPQLSLVPRALLLGAARALQNGVEKYARNAWRTGMSWNSTMDSLLRHAIAYNEGEDFDAESGLCHLDHMAANLAFLLDYRDSHPERDDRRAPAS